MKWEGPREFTCQFHQLFTSALFVQNFCVKIYFKCARKMLVIWPHESSKNCHVLFERSFIIPQRNFQKDNHQSGLRRHWIRLSRIHWRCNRPFLQRIRWTSVESDWICLELQSHLFRCLENRFSKVEPLLTSFHCASIQKMATEVAQFETL